MSWARRTKIVATLGPATDRPGALAAVIAAGADVVRLNLSHGPLDDHRRRLDATRQVADECGRVVAVLADLPGPKLRTGEIPVEGIEMVAGREVALVAGRGRSRPGELTVDDRDALDALVAGDRVVLGDGDIVLSVTGGGGGRVTAEVRSGGRLRGRPGVHLPAERVRATAFTAADRQLLAAMVGAGVDVVAVSFVRRAADVAAVRAALPDGGPLVLAKIETGAAVDDLTAILDVADAVMVARGDLGIDRPVEDVPHLQKRIIRAATAAGRPVVTATQMLESMVTSPLPTRAEATDVANAVADGTDAVMLSAETAIGRDPAGVVATMGRLVARAERELDLGSWGDHVGPLTRSIAADDAGRALTVTSAVARAAWQAADEVAAAAVLCCTRSGLTARAMARHRPLARLVGLSPRPATVRQLALSWGVEPLLLPESDETGDLVTAAVRAAVATGRVAAGDTVVVLAGAQGAGAPVTDSLRVVRVGR